MATNGNKDALPCTVSVACRISNIVRHFRHSGRPAIISAALLIVCVNCLQQRLHAESAAVAGQSPACKGITTNISANIATVTIDWRNLDSCDGVRLDKRITDSMTVKLKVVNFNFINYAIEYVVTEKVVESYQTLLKLWSQLFGLAGAVPAAVPPAAPCDSFQRCMAVWALAVERAATNVNNYAHDPALVDKTALNNSAQSTVKQYADMLKTSRADLLVKLDDTLKQTPSTVTEVTQFTQVRARHDEVIARLDAFVSLAALVADGETHVVGKKSAGTIVSVSLTPKTNTGASGKGSANFDYFVNSRLPLVFHVGYSYSKLSDVDFEKVRALSGADLFAQIKNDTNTSAFASYLSVGQAWHSDSVGVYATLGTDFAHPGTNLFVGASIQVLSRAFVNLGAASAIVKGGVGNPVVDQLATAVNARELFQTIESTRKWAPSFGVSFKVF